MHVLLTGGTGYIGSSVLRRLLDQGHDVTAVVRSDESARAVRDAGAEPSVGDITDVAWLTELLRDADGAIHLAAGDDSAAIDDAVLDAVIAAFAGTDKPFVHTGGIWSWGDNPEIHEHAPLAPPQLTAWRGEREQRILDADVHASVVSPGIVHGYGKGIPQGVIVGAPRDAGGRLELVGSGEQRWATVHVDDLAELYVLALTRSGKGERWIGASGHNPTVRELGEVVAGGAGVAPVSEDAVRERLGAGFADALLLDQASSGSKAREVLGWAPSRPTLVEELRGA
ncbi:MAG TPA: NAD-dependent epimerase/dehydratase family protein [Rhodoglobus sp.]|nr:NAD-dependent epimerase/dehydratase family protein [Rhodoglobus sp.]